MNKQLLVDSSGQRLTLGVLLGRGGEGQVYDILNTSNVAKLYHNPVTGSKCDKLQVMCHGVSPGLARIAAWPVSLVSEQAGKVCGYIMPRVEQDFAEIVCLHNPSLRKKAFPTTDYAFIVHAAMNCAAAFATVHKENHIIGDVNQKNILVNSKAMIRLIDCDSFQVSGAGRLFPCEVGVPEYTPPELQGKSFGHVLRTCNHDNFGLAVQIFLLLMMGRHPFAGIYKGANSPPVSLDESIKGYMYAYDRQALSRHEISPPQDAMGFQLLPTRMIEYFERAFGPGSDAMGARPTAEQWRRELGALLQSLVTCPAGHKFPSHVHSCPWCAPSSAIYFEGRTLPKPKVSASPANNAVPSPAVAAGTGATAPVQGASSAVNGAAGTGTVPGNGGSTGQRSPIIKVLGSLLEFAVRWIVYLFLMGIVRGIISALFQ